MCVCVRVSVCVNEGSGPAFGSAQFTWDLYRGAISSHGSFDIFIGYFSLNSLIKMYFSSQFLF